MTADSGRYIQLQNAYIEQANKDVAVITDKVNMLINSLAKVMFLIENIVEVLYDFLLFLSGSVDMNMGCLSCSFYFVEDSKLQCDTLNLQQFFPLL